MPWVVSDYESAGLDLTSTASYRDLTKPVGALNEARLEIFRERFSSLPQGDAFMYGTHYSTPAFVSFYLIRQVSHMKC